MYSDDQPTQKDLPAERERRRAPRRKLTRPVELDLGDGRPSTIALTRDLSETGIALRTKETTTIGDRLACRLRAGAGVIQLVCRVVWTSTQSDGAQGVGLEFEDLTHSRSEKIRSLLSHRTSRTTARQQRYASTSGTWDNPAPAVRQAQRKPGRRKKVADRREHGRRVFWVGLLLGTLIGGVIAALVVMR